MFNVTQGFTIDEEVRAYIRKSGKDFRLSTTPNGPVLLPLKASSPKPSDIKILIGENVLYVSKLQAKYIKRIDWPMVEKYIKSSGSGA